MGVCDTGLCISGGVALMCVALVHVATVGGIGGCVPLCCTGKWQMHLITII